jgi:hypothetical protein
MYCNIISDKYDYKRKSFSLIQEDKIISSIQTI